MESEKQSDLLERLSKKKCKTMVTAKTILAITVATAALVFPKTARAAAGAPTQCMASSSCTVGEFLFNDEYVPITTATCTVTSSYPDGTSFLSGQATTGTADGFYKHAFTAPTTSGYYKTQVCCTSGTDYLCMDKSFEVVAASTSLTTADISSAVWGYSSRSLTGFGNLVSDIWGYSSRDVTNLGTVVRDVWAYTTRTLTGETTATATVASQVNEIRLNLEKLVNQPIITNSFEEEVPDLGLKLDNTGQSLGQLYIDEQYVLSRVGLVALKWPGLSPDEVIANVTELGKLLGDEADDQTQKSTWGDINWLTKSWGWPEMEEVANQTRAAKSSLADIQALVGTSGKSPVAYQELKSALKNLEAAEALIGDSTDAAGRRTAYGRFKQVQGLAAAWEEKKVKLDKLVEGWKRTQPAEVKTRTDGIYKEVMVLNQVPKAEQVISAQFKDISDQKKLKNRVLSLRAVVEANRLLLARNQGSSLTNTWLEEGSIVFKTLVTNPSKLISQEVAVKYYLPPEVKEEDVIDHDSEVEIKYDSEKGQLYAQGQLTIAAGSTKTIMVRVQDIWEITPTQIESVRTQVEELAKPLNKTSFFAQGVTLTSDINASMDKVVSLQEAAVTPEQQIRAFREASIEMAAASEKLAKLQDLVTQAGSAGTLFGFVGGAQVMAVWGLIIIVVAGFVFLALYMRTIASAPVAKMAVQETNEASDSYKDLFASTKPEVHKKPRHLWQAAVHLLLFGAISSATTGVVVWQVMLHSQNTASLASVPEVASTSAVLASVTQMPQSDADADADAGTGGPDIVRVVVPAGSSVNLRDQADDKATIIGKIKVSAEATRQEETAGWTQVDINGQTGWVANQFIQPAPQATGEPGMPLEIVIGETPTGWLRVRQAPNGAEMAKVESGQRYQLLDQTAAWWQIKLADGTVGWVSKQYADSQVVQEVN